jgi:hypothetical protein
MSMGGGMPSLVRRSRWRLHCFVSIAALTAALGLSHAGTAEKDSERVKKLATDGAALIAREGIEKACAILSVPNGPYFQAEYYVFVFDFDVNVAHGAVSRLLALTQSGIEQSKLTAYVDTMRQNLA